MKDLIRLDAAVLALEQAAQAVREVLWELFPRDLTLPPEDQISGAEIDLSQQIDGNACSFEDLSGDKLRALYAKLDHWQYLLE